MARRPDWDSAPPLGFEYLPDFIPPDEERMLVSEIGALASGPDARCHGAAAGCALRVVVQLRHFQGGCGIP